MAAKPPFFHSIDHNYGFPSPAFDPSLLPDWDHEFLGQEDLDAFAQALQAPEPLQSSGDDTASLKSPGLRSVSSLELTKRHSQVVIADEDSQAVAAAAAAAAGELNAPGSAAGGAAGPAMFITAQNDWAPVNEKVHRRGSRRRRRRANGAATALLGERTTDETREGLFYALLRWPILGLALAWLAGLGVIYMFTRFYIWIYEHFVTWRGQRQRLRRNMRVTSNYQDWVVAAKELDAYLGRQRWKEENEFAYYDSKTVRRVWDQIRKLRVKAETDEGAIGRSTPANTGKKSGKPPVEELRALIEACVKNNFVGVENPRLYSQTYYGTKNLVQNFVDEGEFFPTYRMLRWRA
jgi:hypothetical protein